MGLVAVSIHLHFRAAAESEIRDDHTWLAEFMSNAWDHDDEEYAAGIATSINKSFDALDRLYAAAAVPEASTVGGPWTLPVYGGRPVPHDAGPQPTDWDPPMMLLEAAGVCQAAEFLAQVSFDDLWHVAYDGLPGTTGIESLDRKDFLFQHQDLRRFYAQAADAGHAVVKCVWA